jgi:hypothetical protein
MLSPDKLTLAANADLIGTPGGAAHLTTPALVLDLERFRAKSGPYDEFVRRGGYQAAPAR